MNSYFVDRGACGADNSETVQRLGRPSGRRGGSLSFRSGLRLVLPLRKALFFATYEVQVELASYLRVTGQRGFAARYESECVENSSSSRWRVLHNFEIVRHVFDHGRSQVLLC